MVGNAAGQPVDLGKSWSTGRQQGFQMGSLARSREISKPRREREDNRAMVRGRGKGSEEGIG